MVVDFLTVVLVKYCMLSVLLRVSVLFAVRRVSSPPSESLVRTVGHHTHAFPPLPAHFLARAGGEGSKLEVEPD